MKIAQPGLCLVLLFIFLSGATCLSVQATEEPPVRFGVLSIAPPSRIYLKWQPFVDYVSTELGQPLEIVVPRGFKKMKTAAAKGEVDFFYVNSHVFYRLKQEGKAVGVAQMQNINGQVTSQSEIFVRKDSGITSIKQLKGKSFAFVSPMGAGGYLAPRAMMYETGIKTKKDVNEIFTKNLTTSIHKVLLGDIDAGTMCGVNFRLMSKKVDTGDLKVIGLSEPYPENVIAARKFLNKDLIKKFRKIVINMPNSEKGRKVLEAMKKMKIQRFNVYDPEIEKITRELLKKGKF